MGLKYLHDKMNRVVETRRVSSDTVRSYLYDAWDRLLETTDSTEANPQCAFSWTDGYSCTGPRTYVRHSAYSYDKAGNRTDSSAVINTGNRLRVYGVHSMDYDADGNLTRKYRTADTTVFNQRLYWNELGQLDSVYTTRSGVLTKARFGYDGFGRRVRKSVGSDTTWFVYDSDNPILELNTASSVTTHYSYYSGIDRPHAMRRNDSTFYFVADQLGSVVGVVKTNETFAATYRYTPFGVLTDSTPGFVNRLRFAGREYDIESGLYYNRARYYDPQVGRFISEDPIGLAGGINVYAYAANDPVNTRDPLGLRPCTDEERANGWTQTDHEDGSSTCKAPTTLPVQITNGSGSGRGKGPAPPAGPPAVGSGRGYGPGNFSTGGAGGGGRGTNATNIGETGRKRFQATPACVSEHYGLGDLADRAVSWGGAFPLYKPWLGIPVVGNSSLFTNPISYFGHQVFPEARLSGKILGTPRVFGVVGRANVYLATALLVYDIVSIGHCALEAAE